MKKLPLLSTKVQCFFSISTFSFFHIFIPLSFLGKEEVKIVKFRRKHVYFVSNFNHIL